MDNSKIEIVFNEIGDSLFYINGKLSYDEITIKLIELSNVILETETDEFTWSIGEYHAYSLDSLIVGAYWHYTEWHGGQSSTSYAALSALGAIFTPGYSDGPEDDTSEKEVFTLLDAMAFEQQTLKEGGV